MTMTVSKSEFRPRALEFFNQVQRTGQPLIITERGKPVLRVSPVVDDPERYLAPLRGSVLSYDAPMEPVAEAEWEAMR